MARPLFGFRHVGATVEPVPEDVALVRRVLAAPRGQRMAAARKPGDTPAATLARIKRILAHRDRYRRGDVLAGMAPQRRIVRALLG